MTESPLTPAAKRRWLEWLIVLTSILIFALIAYLGISSGKNLVQFLVTRSTSVSLAQSLYRTDFVTSHLDLTSIDLNHGPLATYFQHLAHENTPKAKPILVEAGQVGNARLSALCVSTA